MSAAAIGLGSPAPAGAQPAPPAAPSGPAIVHGGDWYLRDSPTSGPATNVFRYGAPGDIAVMGDWDGDGDKTVGVVRFTETPGGFVYTWYLRDTNGAGSATVTPFVFGIVRFVAVDQLGTIPIVGDWDGDGDDTVGVMTYDFALDGPMHWQVRNSNTAGPADLSVAYSRGRDRPVVGDWDGDGDDTIGVYRPGQDRWLLRNSINGGAADLNFVYGSPAYLELPVVGDWDGNGTDTPAVLRNVPPTDEEGGYEHWLLRNSNSGGGASGQITYGSDAFTLHLPIETVPRLAWTTTPPAPVTVIDAGAGGGSGEVAVTWDAAAGATGYRVLRSDAPGGQFAVVAEIDITTGTATAVPGVTNVWSQQHTYVPPGGRLARPDRSPWFQYVDYGGPGQRCYQVIASNGAGDAPASPVACGSPPGG